MSKSTDIQHSSPHSLNRSSFGFTLVELLLSLGILSSITVFAIVSLGNQVESRNKMIEVSRTAQELDKAMSHLYNDIRHGYLLPKKGQVLLNSALKPYFVGKEQTLSLMTHGYHSYVANTPESNIVAVKYYLKKDDSLGSSKNMLIRAIDNVLKESISRDGIGQDFVLLHDVKDFKITYWSGVDFVPEWDASSGDTQGKLPKMAKIKLAIEAPLTDAEKQRIELNPLAQSEPRLVTLESIVYLMNTAQVGDVKTPAKEYKWQL